VTTTPQTSTAAPVKRKCLASNAPHSNPPDPGPTTRISTTSTTAPDIPPQTEATPNPKPRKHQTTCPNPLHPVPRFPYACFLPFHCHFSAVRNTKQTQIEIPDQADAIAIPTLNKPRRRFHPAHSLTHLFRGRRSATPIPPYEPPREVFTPPREVSDNPPPSRPSLEIKFEIKLLGLRNPQVPQQLTFPLHVSRRDRSTQTRSRTRPQG
jgi:hypothetical protein